MPILKTFGFDQKTGSEKLDPELKIVFPTIVVEFNDMVAGIIQFKMYRFPKLVSVFVLQCAESHNNIYARQPTRSLQKNFLS